MNVSRCLLMNTCPLFSFRHYGNFVVLESNSTMEGLGTSPTCIYICSYVHPILHLMVKRQSKTKIKIND